MFQVPLPTLSPKAWAAIALVAVAVACVGTLWWLVDSRADYRDEAERLRDDITALNNTVSQWRASSKRWQRLAKDENERANAFVEQARIDAEKANAKIAELTAKEADASAALSEWMNRYADTLRNEECAAQARMKLCRP